MNKRIPFIISVLSLRGIRGAAPNKLCTVLSASWIQTVCLLRLYISHRGCRFLQGLAFHITIFRFNRIGFNLSVLLVKPFRIFEFLGVFLLQIFRKALKVLRSNRSIRNKEISGDNLNHFLAMLVIDGSIQGAAVHFAFLVAD